MNMRCLVIKDEGELDKLKYLLGVQEPQVEYINNDFRLIVTQQSTLDNSVLDCVSMVIHFTL